MFLHLLTRYATILAGFVFLALASCGVAGGDGDSTNMGNASKAKSKGAWTNAIVEYVPGDKFIGSPDATVTLVEYASVTCPACAVFHQNVWPAIKQKYIDTGQVNFVFRDYPTPPANIAIAGFAVARCKGDNESYFEIVDDLFEHQNGILSAYRAGVAKNAIEEVAKRNGINKSTFEKCIRDADTRKEIKKMTDYGRTKNVNATPTFFLNGRRLDRSDKYFEVSGLSAAIDRELRLMNPSNTTK